MFPPKYVEFVIIHLIYVKSRKKHLMMTRERTRPSGTVAPARTWYAETYFTERAMMDLEDRIKYKEWRIFSGDADLFTIDGIRYDQCYIFLGVETSYWFFFENEPGNRNLEGNGVLRCSLCGCCIFRQYQMIVENIKLFIQAHRQDNEA